MALAALLDAVPLTAVDGIAGRNTARDIRYVLLGGQVAAGGTEVSWRPGVFAREWDSTLNVYSSMRVIQDVTASRTVRVLPGWYTCVRSGQGVYIGHNTTTTSIELDPANGTNPRIDVVWAIVYDKAPAAFPADPDHGAYLGYTTGTASGTPAVPAIPTGAVALAEISRPVPASDPIPQANITDKRKSTSMQGAVRPLLPGDALADTGGYHGEHRVRTGAFVHATISSAGVKSLVDYWDATAGIWRGTQRIKFPRPAATPVASLGGLSAHAVVQLTVPDPGWPYYLEVSGSMLIGITGGATTALTGVYIQFNIDDTSFNPSPLSRRILRVSRGGGTSMPQQIVTPAATYPTALTGGHVVCFILYNDSSPSNFLTVADNEYFECNVAMTPA